MRSLATRILLSASAGFVFVAELGELGWAPTILTAVALGFWDSGERGA